MAADAAAECFLNNLFDPQPDPLMMFIAAAVAAECLDDAADDADDYER